MAMIAAKITTPKVSASAKPAETAVRATGTPSMRP